MAWEVLLWLFSFFVTIAILALTVYQVSALYPLQNPKPRKPLLYLLTLSYLGNYSFFFDTFLEFLLEAGFAPRDVNPCSSLLSFFPACISIWFWFPIDSWLS